MKFKRVNSLDELQLSKIYLVLLKPADRASVYPDDFANFALCGVYTNPATHLQTIDEYCDKIGFDEAEVVFELPETYTEYRKMQ